MSYLELFSGHAEQYAAARPRYPDALYEWLAGVTAKRELAWDAATGNGQAAHGLVRHFARVIATDASADQLAHAEPHSRITYRQAAAESSGLESNSADVITVAQALHWLDLPAFFAEAVRVLAPGGVFAAWTYALARISPAIDAELRRLADVTLGNYWSDRRRLVDEGYRSVAIPFSELECPVAELTADWTLEQFAAYVRTWSAVQRFMRERARDPVDELVYTIAPFWGEPHERRIVRWPLSVRAGQA